MSSVKRIKSTTPPPHLPATLCPNLSLSGVYCETGKSEDNGIRNCIKSSKFHIWLCNALQCSTPLHGQWSYIRVERGYIISADTHPISFAGGSIVDCGHLIGQGSYIRPHYGVISGADICSINFHADSVSLCWLYVIKFIISMVIECTE